MSNTTEKVTKTNRHYGEGSIYQHKDGRWVAKYRDEAMAKPQYLYGSTEAEVRRKLRDWKKQTARGLTACKKVFFRDYADNWFYTFKQHSVENSSFDRYESIYLHHIKPVLGDIQIASIRSEEIQNLLVAKSKTLSYSVVKKINFLLSELFPFGRSKLNALLRAGVLPVTKVGRDYITTRAELDRWFAANRGREIFY